jgi:hypothetical protein
MDPEHSWQVSPHLEVKGLGSHVDIFIFMKIEKFTPLFYTEKTGQQKLRIRN